ncbi:MAG: threonine synthase [Chloroflexi bacterium]|nr:threonine synthase [Chloroflexota bacterium]
MTFHFKCTLCGAEYESNAVRYVCPKHGDDGILDTILDYKAIAATTSPRQISESRDFSIWRYAPLLPIDDAHASRFAPPLHVGWTPLYRATKAGAQLGLSNLYLKDDGRNPTASFKDRASAFVVAKARELGVEIITTASTGNAGAALAGLAAAAQMPTVIFVPQTAPQAKIAQLLIFGSRVMLVKGNYDQAFDLCLAASKEFGWYCRNTAYNPFTVEGKKTASFEICEQLMQITNYQLPIAKWTAPDSIFVSVGDGNIISGLWKGLGDLLNLGWINQMPKLMGIQAEGSAACYNAWKAGTEKITPVNATTIADSISADIPRDGVRAVRAVRETGGAYLTVSDDEILAAIRDLARTEAVFAEPAASTAYAGLQKAVKQGLVKSDETIVCLITGSGLKDIKSAMQVAGEGTLIEPSLDAVKRIL